HRDTTPFPTRRSSDLVVPRGATTAEPQMQKIRAANPDAMFMAGVLTLENVLILRAYRQMGLKFPIHSSYNLSVPQYMSVAKGLRSEEHTSELQSRGHL